MTVSLAQKIAEDIVKVFQTESLEYYFLKQTGRKPQGKLYDKYFNMVRKLKQSGVLLKRPYCHKNTLDTHKRFLKINSPEKGIEGSIEAIFIDNCTWAELENHWSATKNYRLHEMSQAKCTSDVLNKWTQYKKPFGFKLVDMDFKQLCPKAECFHTNFKTFSLKINAVFEDRIKDHSSKLLFKSIIQMENITENGRCIGIFYLLHSILIPTATIFSVKDGKKSCTRFSIRGSQKSFVFDGTTVAACERVAKKI